MKWIGVLFIGGLLADEMITFSSLNVEQGVMTKVLENRPSRKAKTSRGRHPSRKLLIPHELIPKQKSCGEFSFMEDYNG